MATYISQAKEFIVNTFESLKDSMTEEYPQHSTNHRFDYMNDIANGRWNKLKHVDPVNRNTLKNLDWNNYKMAKWDRTPLWNSINANNWKLKHVETKDTSRPYIERSFRLRKIGEQRKALLNNIRRFNTKKLNFVPWNRLYICDISSSNWKLNHVTPVERTPLSNMNWQGFKLNKFDRLALWNSIRSGAPQLKLKHVEMRSNGLFIEPGYKLKKMGDQRKKLMNEIVSFDRQSMKKPFLEDIANCKWAKLKSVQTTDKSQMSSLGWNSFNARRRVLDEVLEFSKNPQFNSAPQKEIQGKTADLPAVSRKAEAMQ